MRNFRSILREIAKNNHTTPEAVYREMQIAINAGFDDPNPTIRAAWQNIPFKGTRPTPEDVVMVLGKMLSRTKTQR